MLTPSGAHAPVHLEAITSRYLVALATTLVLEVPAVVLGYRGIAPRSRRIAVALAANLASHGLLWSVWGWLPGAYAARLAGAELGVVLAEALAYALLLGGSARRALAVSAVANALSTAAGLALWRIVP